MNDLLGMLDTLSSIIQKGKPVPFLDKVLVDPKEIDPLIQKIRDSISGHYLPKWDALQASSKDCVPSEPEGAKEYADYVLSHLEFVITKLKKEVVKLEKHIESGRQFLERNSHAP
jgi:hypothetical protein